MLSPEQVIAKSFTTTRFQLGYGQDEVDDFLDVVVAELRRLARVIEERDAEIAAMKGAVGAPGAASTDSPAATPQPSDWSLGAL